MADPQKLARRMALTGMLVSGMLAVAKIVIGLLADSTVVVADGVESASDVLASGIVLFALLIAAIPPDENHPYGHGRFETLMGHGVGLILVVTGLGICYRSFVRMGSSAPPPAAYAVWPLIASVLAKSGLAVFKYRYGKRAGSSALVADAYNDSVDILSGAIAILSLGLALYDPNLRSADHYGGCIVGLIVVFLGLMVMHETGMQLLDTMPGERRMTEIRRVALEVPGAMAVEKCYARKTGLKYHADLHLEVDPAMSVAASHDIATEVRMKIRHELEWVEDVLVHVEPFRQ